jgi:hypothetical protein
MSGADGVCIEKGERERFTWRKREGCARTGAKIIWGIKSVKFW